MKLFSVRKLWMYFLISLNYILIKFNYVILTRIPHHTLGAQKWFWDSLFSLVIVGSTKYTYEIVFCEKVMNVLFGSIFYNVYPCPLQDEISIKQSTEN